MCGFVGWDCDAKIYVLTAESLTSRYHRMVANHGRKTLKPLAVLGTSSFGSIFPGWECPVAGCRHDMLISGNDAGAPLDRLFYFLTKLRGNRSLNCWVL